VTGPGGPAAIRTVGLVKDFRAGFWRRRVRVLHGLDLSVAPGEVFGYLGPNGAGKTTTLKLLTGLIAPTAGEAWVLGEPAGSVAAKARIGFLPENPYFYDYLTGLEFLDYGGRLHGLPRRARRERARELLAELGLAQAASVALRKYSKGMLQRIGLAQALLSDPDLVFLDEPMSGLDPVGRRDFREVILRLRDRGRTILFSSHILPDVEVICDRVGILVAGRLIRAARLEELLAESVESVEITASTVPPDALARAQAAAGAGARPGPRLVLTCPDGESAQRALAILVEAKARVHAVVPVRQSLEELLLRLVERR
jgi:ABC-2 type transport system ATP-binding protein